MAEPELRMCRLDFDAGDQSSPLVSNLQFTLKASLRSFLNITALSHADIPESESFCRNVPIS